MANAIHDFGSGMKPFDCAQGRFTLPKYREGLTEWKVEIGDGVQDLAREALCPECSFSRNVGECADRVMKSKYSSFVGF